MMGPEGIMVAFAMFWLTGVVGAASLPPDDQYSPQQSPYRRDVAQGHHGYSTWLKYQQDSATRLEPLDNTPDSKRSDDTDFSRERMSRKDSVIRDLDHLPLAPGGWEVTSDVIRNSSKSARLNLSVLEDSDISAASVEDHFIEDDSFQDQGPGSVEVYKLDLHRENSLLVPHANEKQPVVGARTKSKIPKKATAKEILWKLKSIDSSKTSLPAIFQQPPHSRRQSTLPRQSRRKIKEDRKDEVFTVGGVPELQVGCEGLEASERDKRSSRPDLENIDERDWDNSHKYQDPVYRESTEPILLRVTPIVLDLEEEEPPSGEVYEELDELLKLKKLESTSPKPTTRRWNRADIDPALEMDKHHEELTIIETFPERGDLGLSNGSSTEVKGSIAEKDSEDHRLEKPRFRRSIEDESLKHQSTRRLLWVQYPERQEYANQGTMTRKNQDVNHHSDLWGFREEDGDLSDNVGDAELDKLREAEAEKRRREYERRRQEELDRRRGGRGHRPHEDHSSRSDGTNSEIVKIRQDYERQLEKEQRERQRIEEERRRQGGHKRGGEDDQRRMKTTKREQEEETRRRLEEEQRRNSDPWHSKRKEEEDRRSEWNRRRKEEEERLKRLDNQRNHQDPPSSLTRPEPSHYPGNTSRSREEKEGKDQKLREYIERNRPIDPKNTGTRRRPDEESRRNEDNERRRHMEEERRRQQMGEHRRRQQQSDEDERRKQMEEHRRRQQQRDEDEMRRQMEEQRRRDRPESRAIEEERRRRLEEERKLQEYVRRNQPVNVPKRNNSESSIPLQESRNLEEQRRTIEAARQWERNRRPSSRTNDGRIHGPSAPTSMGHRQSQWDLEEIRRNQERREQEHRRESEWQRLAEEERRREAEIRRAESRRHEEERKRLEAAVRTDEENRRAQSEGRRNSWQDSGSSHRPAMGSPRYDPTDEVRDWEAEELRRQEAADRSSGNTMRNRGNEWGRRPDDRDRQRKQQEESERQRLENERNSRNNERRRPQHEDTGPKLNQRGESIRGGYDGIEWRRREHARLSSLPVMATIVLRSDDASKNHGGASSSVTLPTPSEPSIPSFESRGNFGNEIDFPAMNPHRPGLAAPGFPAAPTASPPVKSPGACIWAIVQCCPAKNRLTSCFESMGCPGVNWDPSPCRASLVDAARTEVLRFYEAADE